VYNEIVSILISYFFDSYILKYTILKLNVSSIIWQMKIESEERVISSKIYIFKKMCHDH